MGRREDLGRHHTIRRTQDMPKDKNNRRMVLFTIAMALVVFAMAKAGTLAPAPQSSEAAFPPKPDDLRLVIDQLSEGRWGPELADKIELLADSQWPDGAQYDPAREYTLLLQAGASPDSASPELLAGVALYLGEGEAGSVPQEVLERYKKALSAAHENRPGQDP